MTLPQRRDSATHSNCACAVKTQLLYVVLLQQFQFPWEPGTSLINVLFRYNTKSI